MHNVDNKISSWGTVSSNIKSSVICRFKSNWSLHLVLKFGYCETKRNEEKRKCFLSPSMKCCEKTIKSGMHFLKVSFWERERYWNVLFATFLILDQVLQKIHQTSTHMLSFQDVILNLAVYIPIGKKAKNAWSAQNYLEWDKYKYQMV